MSVITPFFKAKIPVTIYNNSEKNLFYQSSNKIFKPEQALLIKPNENKTYFTYTEDVDTVTIVVRKMAKIMDMVLQFYLPPPIDTVAEKEKAGYTHTFCRGVYPAKMNTLTQKFEATYIDDFEKDQDGQVLRGIDGQPIHKVYSFTINPGNTADFLIESADEPKKSLRSLNIYFSEPSENIKPMATHAGHKTRVSLNITSAEGKYEYAYEN